MENLEIYNRVRTVPETAKKPIQAGRLKGMTDINPMWRIKMLTETFGLCGIGWKTEIVDKWLDEGANGEITANMTIKLYVKVDGAWSDGIPGVGGSHLTSAERNGLYTDDECYKKAYTDAMSVACKALGIGADVYWDKDTTKYTPVQPKERTGRPAAAVVQHGNSGTVPGERYSEIQCMVKSADMTMDIVSAWIKAKFKAAIQIHDLTDEQYTLLREAIQRKIDEKR